MARTIVVNWDGEISEFAISRVNRQKLYGRKRKVVVDEEGAPTETAYLTRDGSALLLKGSMASLYVNEDFDVTERSDLQAVDAEGNALEKVDSTLGVEQPLEGPVEPNRVLDHVAKAVYQLDVEALGDQLRKALEDGDIFETKFNYRKGFDWDPVFLLHNGEGFFAVVGEESTFDFLYKEQMPNLEEEEDDEDPFGEDDLDFSMF
jgi:hypothetical protein